MINIVCLIRELMGFLPSNNLEDAPTLPTRDRPDRICESLNTMIPDSSKKPYDMLALIQEVVDEKYFLEIHKNFAQNIIVGFARLNGRSVGIVANQPQFLAGCLNIEASRKAARFIRFVMLSIFRLFLLLMFQDFCQEQIKNGMV